jgi:hypothetical protein
MRTHALCHAALFVALAISLIGCGPKEYVISGTSRAAGMDGKIRVEEIEGGNTMIKVELEHMVPPGRLGNGLAHYVLWIQSQNQQPQREANVEYDPDDRKGRATATTPAGNFTVIITAERTAAPVSPSDVVVARRQVSRDN